MELLTEISKPDRIVIVRQKEVKKQVNFIGSVRPQGGQKVYELNLKTQEIKVAEFDDSFVTITGAVTRKIILKDNHWYVLAINTRNAAKKFIKRVRKIK